MGAKRLSLFGDVVNDDDFLEDRQKFFDECLVGWVWGIDIEPGLVLETDEETMGQAVVFIFLTEIGAPLEAGDGVNFCWEAGKVLFDAGNLLGFGIVIKFEHD